MDKARECALLPGVEEALIYYSPLEVVRHEIGAKPYAVRYYITADSREELDSLSEKLFRDVDIVDDAGNTMLYHNQMTSY